MNKFIDLLFRAYDCNKDGELTFQEFLTGKKLFESKDIKDNIRFIFRLLDMTKDKKIELNEIELFLKTLHQAADLKENDEFDDKEYAQRLINDLDTDKDGSLSEEEFLQGIMNNEYYVSFIRSIIPQDLF